MLMDIFSTVGPVLNIRTVTDRETGKSRGYCFIEYETAHYALSAIRNLDGYEMMNRKLKVSYSNNSSLREMAHQTGQSVVETSSKKTPESVTADMNLADAYDVLAGIKNMVDEDRGQRAKEILQAQPQLVPALVAIQQRLGIIPAGRSEEAGWGDYKYGQ